METTMKKILTALLFLVTAQAFAVDIARRDDTYITVDVITNTTGGAYENFEVITMHPNGHKVTIIRPNGRYQTEFCNQVDKNADAQCQNYEHEKEAIREHGIGQADGGKRYGV